MTKTNHYSMDVRTASGLWFTADLTQAEYKYKLYTLTAQAKYLKDTEVTNLEAHYGTVDDPCHPYHGHEIRTTSTKFLSCGTTITLTRTYIVK